LGLPAILEGISRQLAGRAFAAIFYCEMAIKVFTLNP
jgi:hypothetical protein